MIYGLPLIILEMKSGIITHFSGCGYLKASAGFSRGFLLDFLSCLCYNEVM